MDTQNEETQTKLSRCIEAFEEKHGKGAKHTPFSVFCFSDDKVIDITDEELTGRKERLYFICKMNFQLVICIGGSN